MFVPRQLKARVIGVTLQLHNTLPGTTMPIGAKPCCQLIFKLIHHQQAPRQVLKGITMPSLNQENRFRALPQLKGTRACLEQVACSFLFLITSLTPTFLQDFPAHQVTLCWQNVTSCPPSEVFDFVRYKELPNMLPETPIQAIIRTHTNVVRFV